MQRFCFIGMLILVPSSRIILSAAFPLLRQLPEVATRLYREEEADASSRFAWLSQLAGKDTPVQE